MVSWQTFSESSSLRAAKRPGSSEEKQTKLADMALMSYVGTAQRRVSPGQILFVVLPCFIFVLRCFQYLLNGFSLVNTLIRCFLSSWLIYVGSLALLDFLGYHLVDGFSLWGKTDPLCRHMMIISRPTDWIYGGIPLANLTTRGKQRQASKVFVPSKIKHH